METMLRFSVTQTNIPIVEKMKTKQKVLAKTQGSRLCAYTHSLMLERTTRQEPEKLLHKTWHTNVGGFH